MKKPGGTLAVNNIIRSGKGSIREIQNGEFPKKIKIKYDKPNNTRDIDYILQNDDPYILIDGCILHKGDLINESNNQPIESKNKNSNSIYAEISAIKNNDDLNYLVDNNQVENYNSKMVYLHRKYGKDISDKATSDLSKYNVVVMDEHLNVLIPGKHFRIVSDVGSQYDRNKNTKKYGLYRWVLKTELIDNKIPNDELGYFINTLTYMDNKLNDIEISKTIDILKNKINLLKQ